MDKYSMLVDVTKCIGCYSCRVACQMENELPPDQSYISFREVEKGVFPNTQWVMQRFSCLHCSDAVCEKVCPKNAISYSEHGAVIVDENACIGCGYCMKNCPFQVPQVQQFTDAAGNKTKKMKKCTQCYTRVTEGLNPACVSTCISDALSFGNRDEILQGAELRLQEVKERYPEANIYNPSGVGGTHTIFLLAHHPSEYGLQNNPKIPAATLVWKDFAQPIGKALLGVTTMAVISGAISNRLFNKENNHKGGDES